MMFCNILVIANIIIITITDKYYYNILYNLYYNIATIAIIVTFKWKIRVLQL